MYNNDDEAAALHITKPTYIIGQESVYIQPTDTATELFSTILINSSNVLLENLNICTMTNASTAIGINVQSGSNIVVRDCTINPALRTSVSSTIGIKIAVGVLNYLLENISYNSCTTDLTDLNSSI